MDFTTIIRYFTIVNIIIYALMVIISVLTWKPEHNIFETNDEPIYTIQD